MPVEVLFQTIAERTGTSSVVVHSHSIQEHELTQWMKNITCVEFFENFMFGKFRIQVCYVVDVPDAITKAANLKISLSEGLDVLDFLSPILK